MSKSKSTRPGVSGETACRPRCSGISSAPLRLARASTSLPPHDLRRTCARLCHLAGGELDQIQFLLGHVSIHTTDRYLGCKQKLRIAVSDPLGIEPDTA